MKMARETVKTQEPGRERRGEESNHPPTHPLPIYLSTTPLPPNPPDNNKPVEQRVFTHPPTHLPHTGLWNSVLPEDSLAKKYMVRTSPSSHPPTFPATHLPTCRALQQHLIRTAFFSSTPPPPPPPPPPIESSSTSFEPPPHPPTSPQDEPMSIMGEVQDLVSEYAKQWEGKTGPGIVASA